MRKKRIIIVALGETSVWYGENRNMPRAFLELVSTSGADSWTLTRRGAIAYFLHSRRIVGLLQDFFIGAESLRDDFPLIGIGVAHDCLGGQFDWLGRLKRNFHVDSSIEQRALDNVQGAQTYRQVLEELARL